MCLSRAAIRLETACWLIPSSSAAAWNWPVSATATNVRSTSTSTLPPYFHNCWLCLAWRRVV
ncbi:transmembrane efflux protein [Streptomyces hygroscopicus]|nr:transmembrane efflux protein [Streptomyces hygroscopicus]